MHSRIASETRRALRTYMRRRRAHPTPLVCAAWLAMPLLAACGGGGGDDDNDSPSGGFTIGASCTALPPAAPPRLLALSAAELASLANETAANRRLMQLVGTPVCGVDV